MVGDWLFVSLSDCVIVGDVVALPCCGDTDPSAEDDGGAVADPSSDALDAALLQGDGDAVGDIVTECREVVVSVKVAEPRPALAVTDTEPHAEGHKEGETDTVSAGERDTLLEGNGERVVLSSGEGEGEGVSLAVGSCVTVSVALGHDDVEPHCDTLDRRLRDAAAVALRLKSVVKVAEAPVGDALLRGVRVAFARDPLGERDRDQGAVGDIVPVIVAHEVLDAHGDALGDEESQ